ncbi:WecB/TagA/CpsF family glycosyltransferase [Bacillus sp. mrc49]|uniref:WecB/TagA/CpsF family glycosyltransferase n=1 Tax=Bacillus sp. mrc49 TaxID=2054913 RepID=UPI000C27FA1D|nr:WecB/TagA/CpsF family glycosyltransferase [Bacillus sp. mrc49]PJN90314.1 glycosyltransferase [Bacillus sp. mrc49]
MRINLLGSELDCLSFDQTIESINEIIQSHTPTQHVVLNANKINQMRKDKELSRIINECNLINADGISIVLAAKILGYSNVERVTGVDIFVKLLEVCSEKGYRVYFLGATEEVVRNVVKTAKHKHADLMVAGYRNGYFKDEESSEIAEDIRKSSADVLFVAFPSPQKEFWIKRHLQQMDVPFVMGVGGSFDVLSGNVKRAPKWVQKIGMEWFVRFIQEPRRMFKRYFIGNFTFLWLVYRERFFKKDKR